jgi:hypothetical protein
MTRIVESADFTIPQVEIDLKHIQNRFWLSRRRVALQVVGSDEIACRVADVNDSGPSYNTGLFS